MGKKHKTSYPLAIFLQTASTVLPFAAIIYFLYNMKAEPLFTILDIPISLPVLLLLIAFMQWLVLKAPLKAMYNKAIQDNEYDEFGMSKKKKFENLTRKEREAMDLQKAAQMESLLSASVFAKIKKEGSRNPEADLNAMIGIPSVKEKVAEMAARMKFEKATRKRGKKNSTGSSMSGRHMVFYGSAGTGKTSVARIITGFLYQNGYIKENKCIEIDGNFLKAGEESATKTRLIIQKSYGGVLFIDEAYTIMDGSGGYGREAIATLIKEMEDNRDKFIVILAGYKADMKRLLDTNEGFKSRIKEYLEFEDYNVQEMKEIFQSMAHSAGFAVSQDAMDNFEIRCEKERRLSSFGNGRTVRNILDESIDRHALNYGKGILTRTSSDGKAHSNDENKFILCGCDVSSQMNRAVL